MALAIGACGGGSSSKPAAESSSSTSSSRASGTTSRSAATSSSGGGSCTANGSLSGAVAVQFADVATEGHANPGGGAGYDLQDQDWEISVGTGGPQGTDVQVTSPDGKVWFGSPQLRGSFSVDASGGGATILAPVRNDDTLQFDLELKLIIEC